MTVRRLAAAATCALLTAAPAAPPSAGVPTSAGAPLRKQDGERPSGAGNILLVTVQGLRADRLGCYAPGRTTTPAMDALAARGACFDRAYAASPSTVPSVASLLTGLYPPRHHLRDDVGGRLAGGVTTVAAALKRAGYRTGAVIGTARLDSDRGIDAGFDFYDDDIPRDRMKPFTLIRERPAEEVVRLGLAFLDAGKGATPFFLWLDFNDPRYEHAAPEPYKKQFESAPYDGEVAYLDAQIHVLSEELGKRGLERSTHIVLAGVHGEGLGDHGETGHGIYLYETTVRVPLLIVAAGGAPTAADGVAAERSGRRVACPVGLIDVAPTLLDLAGLRSPTGLDGRSLAPLARGGAATDCVAGTRRLYIESMQPFSLYGWSPLFATVEGERKIIAGTRPEAFDLKADPGETKPLEPRPPWAAGLEAFGSALLGSPDPSPDLKARVRRAVAQLQLPWAGKEGCRERADRPDPRDRVELNDALFRVTVSHEIGMAGRAADVSEKEVLPKDPRNYLALEMTAFLAVRNGWREKAAGPLEALQCGYPYRSAAYHLLAHDLEGRGEPQRAEAPARIFALIEPWNEEPPYDLAVLYAVQGKKDLALAQLRKSIALGATNFEFIRGDARLGTVRSDPRFTDLVGPAAPRSPGPK
jgi:arylsulfatase A-like enzyme